MCEAFGELVIQGVLLFRFQWLLKSKDFSSFGLSFIVYVCVSMSVSFIGMLPALLTYHNRGRQSLRETVSLHTACLLTFWIILLVIKVAVYVFGFLNNPGLFWVPMVVKMLLLWLFLTYGGPKCFCRPGNRCQPKIQCVPFKAFKSLPSYDKVVYILVSSLVPISIPSKETKSMKGLYAVSIILFFLECLFVLLFAYLIRHFYHFELYKDFYCNFLPEKLNTDSFDGLVVYMLLAVFASTAIAFLLLCTGNNCCHPKASLFPLTIGGDAMESSKTDGQRIPGQSCMKF